MRRWQAIILVSIVGLFLLGTQRLALPAEAQGEQHVVAFYYAWFDWNTWKLDLSDRPVTPYLSADPATIESHVILARQSGLEALILDWYGPQIENNQTETNLRLLLDKAQAHGLQAGVTVDLAGPFINNQEELRTALLAVRDGHAPHPAYFKVGGRPVLFFWRQETYSLEAWALLREQIDPNRTMIWIAEGTRTDYLEVFDGLYLYSVAWSDDPAAVLNRWGNEVREWSREHNTFRYWVATVMPGYDDRVTGRADAFVQPRNDGDFYRATWRGAIESNADWVAVTSFNEWLEGTHIEPSEAYGNTYLDLTSSLSAAYRQSAVAPSPTLPPPTPTLTPTVVVTPTATPILTPTATPVVTPTATPVLTPTVTLTPTATPFRLPTPTERPDNPQSTPLPVFTSAPQYLSEATLVVPDSYVPERYPVQGSQPRSRSWLPIIVVGVVGVGLLALGVWRWLSDRKVNDV